MFIQARKPPRFINVTCDGCSSEFLETEALDYREASLAMQAANWATAQVKGKFSHYCPGCAVRLGID
jgi:hypothetical protein